MGTLRRIALALAAAACVGVALAGTACSGGGSGSSQAACDQYFDALLGSRCGIAPPADFLAHERARFDQLCGEALAIPDTGVSTAWLNACASAERSMDCRSQVTPAACMAPPGTLATGAACSNGDQCQSLVCRASQQPADAGGACGTCAPGVTCGTATCNPGESCQNGTCAGPMYVGAGGACSGLAQCDSGLYCTQQTKTCAALVGSGGACTNSGDCQWPLVCPLTGQGALTCQSGAPAGAACGAAAGMECAPNLFCDQTAHCSAVQWVAPGQSCAMLGSVCENGTCQNGMCPTVIPDGQPCGMAGTTCDVLASCQTGTCQLPPVASCK